MFTKYYFIRKFIVSVLAILLIGLCLSILGYTPSVERMENTAYMSFGEIFLVYVMFAAPVYLIGGNAFSILVDVFWKRTKNRSENLVYRFILNLILYAIGGCVLLFLYVFLLFGSENIHGLNIVFYLMGMLAGVIYYLLDVIIDIFIQKRNLG